MSPASRPAGFERGVSVIIALTSVSMLVGTSVRAVYVYIVSRIEGFVNASITGF